MFQNSSSQDNLELSLMTELATLNLKPQGSFRGSFSNAISLQRSYGSTNNQFTYANTKLLTHKVERSDTLQGLSVRYGVPLEKIRRLNRLWTNDSIFLRETLLIPIPQMRPLYKSESDEDDIAQNELRTSSETENACTCNCDSVQHGSTEANSDNNSAINEGVSSVVSSGEEQVESYSDFLKALDSRISSCKSKVEKIRTDAKSQSAIPDVAYDSYHAGKTSPTKHYAKFSQDI